jgi:hypothetical protein
LPHPGPAFHGECGVNIRLSVGSGECRLGCCWPDASKRFLDGETQVKGEGFGLIETSRPATGRVQRHRNQRVGTREQVVVSGRDSERRCWYLKAWMIAWSVPS